MQNGLRQRYFAISETHGKMHLKHSEVQLLITIFLVIPKNAIPEISLIGDFIA